MISQLKTNKPIQKQTKQKNKQPAQKKYKISSKSKNKKHNVPKSHNKRKDRINKYQCIQPNKRIFLNLTPTKNSKNLLKKIMIKKE